MKEFTKLYKTLNTVESVQNFINELNITTFREFTKKHDCLYRRCLRNNIHKNDLFFPNEPQKTSYANLNTLEDFLKFVDDNNIMYMSELTSLYSGVVSKMYRLNISLKLLEFKNRKHKDLSNFNELSDFLKYIDDNNVYSITNLRNEHGSVYRRIFQVNFKPNMLKYHSEYKPIKSHNYNLKDFNNLSDFLTFIDEHNILNYSEFVHLYQPLLSKLSRLKLSTAQLVFKNTLFNNYDDLITIEDFLKFIDDNNINSKNDLKRFGGLYHKISKTIDINDLVFKTGNISWKNYNTLSDILSFIDLNNIKSPTEFTRKYGGLLKKMNTLCIKITNLKFSEASSGWQKYVNYNTVQDFQDYIDLNNIQSAKDFMNTNINLYDRMLRLRLCNEVEYPYRLKSTLEIYTEKFLDENNIRYKLQKTFNDLKDKKLLRYDFYLVDYNILIETDGSLHFLENDFNRTEEDFFIQLKHDEMKRKYAETHNIPLVHYINYDNRKGIEKEKIEEILKTLNGDWYTDFDLFKNRILQLCNLI